ncbi:MAG: sigma 54-interacting transcriptional regulator [Candidatus Aminicenantes bacterium]|nr:sigma 54-interacting transcriptional regulator [Candidatus Aminicenantes bacterium]
MKYLLFNQDGFAKKFPLNRSHIKLGRDESNDLLIDDDFISRRHVDIYVKQNSILVQDAGSVNGFFVNNERKEKAEIKIGESFGAGNVTFTLKKGDAGEFSISEKYRPEFVKEAKKKDAAAAGRSLTTRSIQTVSSEIEESMFRWDLRFANFEEFTSYLSSKLCQVPFFGTLFLVEKGEAGKSANIRFSVNGNNQALDRLKKILAKHPEIFQERLYLADRAFCSEPLHLNNKIDALVYLLEKGRESSKKSIKSFLLSLSRGIEMMDKLIEEKKHLAAKKVDKKHIETDIITESEKMKDLIRQARKIAASDIFILIQGESGTGKELFARLIHRCSKRDREKFVALNCAAIPEDLLESELFGYEKGAFTGAYNPKKGKLELASGGTLVLDEIGDMPLSLQTKLLRAIQEHEFYRLGSLTPTKVDLRIISITNRNLEKLIKKDMFREDLYYRLVHRVLTIPPLRDRKEDILPLINYFTNKFCRSMDRSINGYSVKTFEALVDCDWNGNVRQLENEISSIVNLTDDGETVDFDILSEKIKDHYERKEKKEKKEQPDVLPRVFNRKPGREEITEVLKSHNWNKSKAAQALNMTYHGLHKKMKKMGITPPHA